MLHLSSGGIKGGGGGGGENAPQLEALPPPLAPHQKKKWPKSAIFGKFWIFAPSESHFAPSMPPTKKNSGAPTALVQCPLVAITRHNFFNIFQMECFSAVTFAMGYQKNMNFLMIIKIFKNLKKKVKPDWSPLTGGNWQKWKRVFLTCPCHEIYRDEAVGLKSCKNTWKITIFVKMWNLGQYRENLIFCQ